MIAVIFDLDDTLYKEHDYVASGCNAVAETLAARYHQSALTLHQIINCQSDTSTGFDALISFLRAKGNKAVSIAEILEIYRNHEPTLELPDDTKIVLQQLQSKPDIAIGLITDGRSAGQRAKIRSLGLDKIFPPQNIIISEEIGADKHTRVPFELIQQKLRKQFSISQFVYVGDNPRKDFHWPNQLGWLTIQLLDPMRENIKPPITVEGVFAAKTSINSLAELPRTLLSHCKGSQANKS